MLSLLGYAYAITSRRADALKVLQRFDETEKHRYVSRAARVYVYAGLGDKDKAFEWLEKAYQERSDALAWFRQEPESKSLRSDPRFAALMRKIGFAPLRGKCEQEYFAAEKCSSDVERLRRNCEIVYQIEPNLHHSEVSLIIGCSVKGGVCVADRSH